MRLKVLLKQIFFELDFKSFGCGILNFRRNRSTGPVYHSISKNLFSQNFNCVSTIII